MVTNHDLNLIEEQAFGNVSIELPTLPSNILDWIEKARPSLGGKSRNFDLFPFWIDIYEDNHPNIMVVNGRQTFKTTFCSDVLACFATTHSNTESTYVVDNEAHLSAFSMQRLRRDTYLANPALKAFLPHGRANIGTINLLNDAVTYLVTDESEYSKVEGKSNHVLMLDEAQYQDVAFLAKALYSLSQTRGRVYTLGIGGEAGSPYHTMWNRTDQRVWVYKDKYWREKLHFDNKGNITNENLSEVLDGRWVAQRPENTQYRGYHMPQTIFPTIPLTVDDAVLKYHVQPELSIEHQSKNFPRSIYESHCLGEFYQG